MRLHLAYKLVVICFVYVLLSGCLSTQQMARRPAAAPLDLFNEAAAGKRYRILLTDEQVYFGDNAEMTTDSTRFRHKENIQTFSNKYINRITITDKRKGAGKGFKVGGIVGGSAGALLGLRVGGGLCETSCGSEVFKTTTSVGLVGGLVVGVVGALLVGLQGYHDTYVLGAKNKTNTEGK